MAGSDVYVTFGGDTAGLEASLAAAKAQVTAFQRELTSLARQMQAAGDSAESDLGQKVLASAGKLSAAKGTVLDFAGQLAALRGAGAGAEHAIAGIGQAATRGVEGLSFYTREIRALFDELSSGRDRQALGTFTNLAGHFLSAHTALIPLVAGVAAFGAAAAYAGFEFVGFTNAIGKIGAAAALNQIKMTDDQVVALETSIKTLAGVSDSEAADIAAAFLKIGDGGQQIAQIAALYIPQFVRAGDTASEAAKQLAELFLDLGKKGREYVAATQGVSGETLKAYDGFIAAGQSGQAYAIIVDSMRSRLEANREALMQRSAAMKDDTASTADAVAAVEGGLVPAEKTAGVAVADATSKIAAQVAELGRLRDALTEAGSANASFTKGLAAALKFDKIGQDIVTTTGDIATMNQAFRQAASAGDATGVATLAAGIDRATDSLKKLQQQASDGLLGRDATAQADAALAHLDATWKGSTVDRLTAERAVWQAIVTGENSTAEQIAHAQAQVEAKTKEITAASYADYKAAEDVRVAAAGKATAAVIAIRQQEVAKAREIFGAGSDQERAAIEEVARAKEAAATRGASAAKAGAKDEIAASMAATTTEIGNIEKATNSAIEQYAKQAQYHQINESQKVASTLAALQKELDAQEDALGDELALYGLSAKQIQQINDLGLKAEQANADQIVKIQQDAADKVSQQWQNAFNTINSAFTAQTASLLQGSESWGQALDKVLSSLTTDLINFTLKMEILEPLEAQLKNAFSGISLGGAAGSSGGSTGGSAGGAALGGVGSIFGSLFGLLLAPILGPFAALFGLGGAGAPMNILPHLDVGAWEVPHDMTAFIHQGEQIVPASFASGLRSAVTGGGGDSGGGGASMPMINFSPNVTAIDAGGVQAFLQQYVPQFARAIYNYQNLNPSSFP